MTPLLFSDKKGLIKFARALHRNSDHFQRVVGGLRSDSRGKLLKALRFLNRYIFLQMGFWNQTPSRSILFVSLYLTLTLFNPAPNIRISFGLLRRMCIDRCVISAVRYVSAISQLTLLSTDHFSAILFRSQVVRG